MTDRPAIAVDGLDVTFRAEHGPVPVLRDLGFAVSAGDVVVIVGESGSGKTVLATALLGMLPPNTEVGGSIELAGHQIVGATPRQLRAVRRDHAALIPQGAATALNPVRRIGWQARRSVKVRGLGTAAGAERVDRSLATFGLDPASTRAAYPHELSGGMQQRVLLSLAHATEPAVVIADEPTHGLDADLVATTAAHLDGLRAAGAALVVITHDLRLAATLGGSTLVLYAGEVVEHRPTDALLGSPRHPYTAGLLGALPERGAVPIPGMPPTFRAQAPGCAFAPRCELVQAACRHSVPPLLAMDDGVVRCPEVLGGGASSPGERDAGR